MSWQEVSKKWYVDTIHQLDVISPWATIKFNGRWATSEQKLRHGRVVGKTVSDMHAQHDTRYYKKVYD